MAIQELSTRPLAHSDIPVVDEIRRSEGWNQTLTDWRRLIEHQPDGCFVASRGSQVVGTVTTTVHAEKLAWIGMMLVDASKRRQGIGTALMQAALDFLDRRGVPCVKLDATPAGRPVYLELGFVQESEIQRWYRPPEGVGTGTSGSEDLPVLKGEEAAAAWLQVSAIDRQAFGADRLIWCQALARDSQVVVAEGPDGTAVGMLRPGSRENYIGPITGNSPEAARRVIRKLIDLAEQQSRHQIGANAPPGTAFWDIPCNNRVACEEAEAHGFTPVRDLYRMWRGTAVEEAPQLQFALPGPETG